MRTSQTITLPNLEEGLDYQNESIFRRAVEQILQDMRNDMVALRDKQDKASSMALRRHQFLLMGAE